MRKYTLGAGHILSLETIILEVEAEGREVTRRQLLERLKQIRDAHTRFST